MNLRKSTICLQPHSILEVILKLHFSTTSVSKFNGEFAFSATSLLIFWQQRIYLSWYFPLNFNFEALVHCPLKNTHTKIEFKLKRVRQILLHWPCSAEDYSCYFLCKYGWESYCSKEDFYSFGYWAWQQHIGYIPILTELIGNPPTFEECILFPKFAIQTAHYF